MKWKKKNQGFVLWKTVDMDFGWEPESIWINDKDFQILQL